MKKLRVGIIGLGRISRVHIAEMSLHPDKFELVAVADHAPDRLENLPSEVKNAARYHSLDELLKHPGLDLVTICTRHPDHTPMALQIMASGIAALVEKPVATSVAEMEELRAASLLPQSGKLFFRHNRRFEPAFMKVRDLINANAIGEVQYIKLYRSVGYCRRNDWMTMTDFYGGLLSNWGPHLIDQALQLLDSPVCDVWADVRHVISIGDGDDLFKILLKAENGRLADIEVTGANTMPGREMEIIGSRGTIVFNGGDKINVRSIDPAVELKPLHPHAENPPFEYGNFDEKLYFVDAEYDIPNPPTPFWLHVYDGIVNDIPSPITFEQAYWVVKVTEEAFRKSGFAPIRKFLDK